MFTAALSTVSKRWKEPRVHGQMNKENVVHTYNVGLFTFKRIKQGKPVTCYNMGEP